MEKVNLWEKAGNSCLTHAIKLLENHPNTDFKTAKTVKMLVETAVSIDTLNLRWEQQTQCGSAAFWGRTSAQKEAKN